MKAELRWLSAQVTQLREATAAQSGVMDEESKVQDMISGAACGAKRGEPGSLVDRNQCEHEPYSGMASGPWQKKLVQSVLG